MNRFVVALAVMVALGIGSMTVAATPVSYTKDQAWQGRVTYYEHCAECHGGGLEGKFGPALAGGDDRTQYESGSAVYAYYSVSMPHGNPGALSTAEYVDIMAFLYQQHGRPAGTRPLTVQTIAADAQPLGP